MCDWLILNQAVVGISFWRWWCDHVVFKKFGLSVCTSKKIRFMYSQKWNFPASSPPSLKYGNICFEYVQCGRLLSNIKNGDFMEFFYVAYHLKWLCSIFTILFLTVMVEFSTVLCALCISRKLAVSFESMRLICCIKPTSYILFERPFNIFRQISP
jgi:hypothetical protein